MNLVQLLRAPSATSPRTAESRSALDETVASAPRSGSGHGKRAGAHAAVRDEAFLDVVREQQQRTQPRTTAQLKARRPDDDAPVPTAQQLTQVRAPLPWVTHASGAGATAADVAVDVATGRSRRGPRPSANEREPETNETRRTPAQASPPSPPAHAHAPTVAAPPVQAKPSVEDAKTEQVQALVVERAARVVVDVGDLRLAVHLSVPHGGGLSTQAVSAISPLLHNAVEAMAPDSMRVRVVASDATGAVAAREGALHGQRIEAMLHTQDSASANAEQRRHTQDQHGGNGERQALWQIAEDKRATSAHSRGAHTMSASAAPTHTPDTPASDRMQGEDTW